MSEVGCRSIAISSITKFSTGKTESKAVLFLIVLDHLTGTLHHSDSTFHRRTEDFLTGQALMPFCRSLCQDLLDPWSTHHGDWICADLMLVSCDNSYLCGEVSFSWITIIIDKSICFCGLQINSCFLTYTMRKQLMRNREGNSRYNTDGFFCM